MGHILEGEVGRPCRLRGGGAGSGWCVCRLVEVRLSAGEVVTSTKNDRYRFTTSTVRNRIISFLSMEVETRERVELALITRRVQVEAWVGLRGKDSTAKDEE